MIETSLRKRAFAALLCLGLAGCPSTTTTDVDAGRDGSSGDTGTGDGSTTPECTEDSDCDDGDSCTGDETCDEGACIGGTALDDGDACDADGDDTTRDVCVDSACGATRCGDGLTDTDASEECDDGNDVSGDGCDDCRFSCADASDCSDGLECNGAETCSAAHVCETGTALEDGTECNGTTGRCVVGTCLPNSCEADAECNDGQICNGEEVCSPTGCATGPALDCDDANPCTADSCAPAGCVHTLIDADGDGHAAATLGECGDDCNDASAAVNPDAPELCGNTVDDDCDDMVDEVGTTAWFADCDADGYAAAGARTLSACAMPAAGLSMCATGGGWTARDPATESDCNDGNASVNPAQLSFQTTAISGAAPAADFDYDCDTTEEVRVSTAGACARVGFGCMLTEGWDGSAPACGATGDFVIRCNSTILGCESVTEERVQACR